MPTLVGLRRRGFTPQSIRAMVESTGVTKQNAWIEDTVLDGCLRADLEPQAPRAFAVLQPLKLKLTNYAEVFGSLDHREFCETAAHPHKPELGQRALHLRPRAMDRDRGLHGGTRQGYFRLFPATRSASRPAMSSKVHRLRKGREQPGHGRAFATVVPDTKSGTPGADAVRSKGVMIGWVAAHEAVAAEIRLYERLFTPATRCGREPSLGFVNPNSLRVVRGFVEPSLAGAAADQRWPSSGVTATSCPDRVDHRADKPVFNKITGLRDSFAK